MNTEMFLERLNELYLPPEDEFTFVDVPEVRYAVIDGEGNPESSTEFADAKKWLYSVAHLIKPFVKERMGKKYVDPPLEYQFWADDVRDFAADSKDQWKWRVMIAFIDWITEEHFQEAVAGVEEKLGTAPETLRLLNLHEGKCVQIMHIGDYSKVQEICDRLYSVYLPKNDLKPNGPYHEIYLNDPYRTAPEKRRIVIRQPVA